MPQMLKGALVSLIIMMAAVPIPIVHFVAVPLSPFVAGYIGGGVAQAGENRIIWFGLLVAGLMTIPAGVAALLVLFTDFGGGILVFFALAIVPYSWFGITVGALMSYVVRQNRDRTEVADRPDLNTL